MYISVHRSAVGHHIEKLNFQATATPRDRFPDFESIEIDSLLACVADVHV